MLFYSVLVGSCMRHEPSKTSFKKVILSYDDFVSDCDVNPKIICKTKQIVRKSYEQIDLQIPYVGAHGSDRIYIQNLESNKTTDFTNQNSQILNLDDLKDGKYLLSISGCSTGGGIILVLKTN